MLSDVARPKLYVGISQVNRDWLDDRSRDSGLPLTQIVDALITEAREDGVMFRGRPAEVVRP